MNYYEQIKTKIIEDVAYAKVKDYSKENHRVQTYYEIGKILTKAGKHYGEGIIKRYSKELTIEFGKKYGITNLKRMRQFYYLVEKGATVSHQLNWSQWYELLSIKDINKINYYISICSNTNLTVRELRERIKSKEYERLPEGTKNKIIEHKNTNIVDLIPEPILIKNIKNKEILNEKILHELIIEHIEDFMNMLGSGYTFVSSEYKIKIGNRYNYIDLLLFNVKFNCYIVIELKVTELKKRTYRPNRMLYELYRQEY